MVCNNTVVYVNTLPNKKTKTRDDGIEAISAPTLNLPNQVNTLR